MRGSKKPIEKLDETSRKVRIQTNLYQKIIDDIKEDLKTATGQTRQELKERLKKTRELRDESVRLEDTLENLSIKPPFPMFF